MTKRKMNLWQKDCLRAYAEVCPDFEHSSLSYPRRSVKSAIWIGKRITLFLVRKRNARKAKAGRKHKPHRVI